MRRLPMKKKIFIILAIVLIGIAVFILKFMKDAGAFKTLEPHSNYACVKVLNVPGPEDIAIDNSTGTAFVSSFDRRAMMRGDVKQGAIFAYNLSGKPAIKNLTAGLTMKFQPHGISFYTGPDGRKYLFVINHQPPRHFVEIFEFSNNTLVHLERVSGNLMISPNDIAAVGPRQFYFTNDHGSKSNWGRKIEDYLRLSRSTIVYYDGTSLRKVAGDLAYANGIWATADGKNIYATSTIDKKFHVYDRDGATGSLKQVSELYLGTGCDNIDVDVNGQIHLACHPKLLSLIKHMKDGTKKSPSQILEVFKSENGAYSFKETYCNLGEEISAASVAAVYKNRLLMGAIFEDYFLDCTMK
jgi:arylesterase/paraoxonase